MTDIVFRRDPDIVTHSDVEGPPLTVEMLESAERELGVRLPASYVAMLEQTNGGYFDSLACPTTQPTSWAPDHVALRCLYGVPAVGDRGSFGTGAGLLATAYMIGEWGLPDGIVLIEGDGHWWIALDYRVCGPAGEPSVVWLDVELGEDIQLAPDFATFLDMLVPAAHFPVEE